MKEWEREAKGEILIFLCKIVDHKILSRSLENEKKNILFFRSIWKNLKLDYFLENAISIKLFWIFINVNNLATSSTLKRNSKVYYFLKILIDIKQNTIHCFPCLIVTTLKNIYTTMVHYSHDVIEETLTYSTI